MRASAWFIYALGSGWGHLNRAFALAQVAARDRPIHLLVNSPYTAHLAAFSQSTDSQSQNPQSQNLTLHQLSDTDSLAEAQRSIQSTLSTVDYDCLIVDTFPRGLIGELVDLRLQKREICRVLIHRDLSPDYIDAKNLHAFVSQHYDGVLLPGEADVPFAHFPQTKLTAPWLSRDATDLICGPLPHWRLSDNKPLIVVCAAGQPHELSAFGHLASQLAAAMPDATVRCLAATQPATCSSALWIAHWPGLDLLQFADVVVGSGGYNLVYECAALAVPLVAFALPRRYDRQEKRIRQHGRLVSSAEEAVAAVYQLINHQLVGRKCQDLQPRSRRGDRAIKDDRSINRYNNGVQAAIAHVEAWCRLKKLSN